MRVALFLIFSIIAWSLYPLLSIWALEVIDAFTLMLIVQFIACNGAIFFALIALIKKNQVGTYVNLQRELGFDGFLILIIAGACSAFSHIFFMLALGMANKNGITLFMEMWPLMAVFLTPYFIDKKWEATSFKDYIIGIFAFGGIVLIILSDENINWFQNESWEMETLLAYGMALIASYMTAILNLLRPRYSQKLDPLKNSFAAVMIAEGGARFIAVCFILVAITMMQIEMQNPLPVIGLVSIIGVGIFVLGGASLTYALMRAKNPNISLFFYMVPLLSVVWLIVMGVSEATIEVIIGGLMTTGACIYLAYDKETSRRRELAQSSTT